MIFSPQFSPFPLFDFSVIFPPYFPRFSEFEKVNEKKKNDSKCSKGFKDFHKMTLTSFSDA